MARVNIEDSLFKDGRWLNLIIKIGCQYKALGYLTKAWILAQEHWLEYGFVPAKAWPEELNVLIDINLAEKTSCGNIYVKGSKKAFSWLSQKSGAGSVFSEKKTEQLKKAREAKKIKKESNLSERDLNGVCTQMNGSEAPTLTPTLTPTLSLSSYSTSNSSSEEIKNTGHLPKSKKLTQAESDQNLSIWKAYSNAYRLRYGIDALKNATVNSQVSNLRKKLGVEESIRVVEFFISHNDAKYLKNTHSFGFCLMDAETLRTQMLRGKAITNTMVRSFEKANQTQELIKDIEENGI